MLLLLCSVCCCDGKGFLGYFWETGLCALTPGSSPGQALALSRRAGEGTGVVEYGCCCEGGESEPWIARVFADGFVWGVVVWVVGRPRGVPLRVGQRERGRVLW